MRDTIPSEWLRERLSDNDVRALNAGGRDAYETGVWEEAQAWPKLRGAFLPGDEVWRYCSPLPTWQEEPGERGVALIRAGAVVAAAASYRSRFG